MIITIDLVLIGCGLLRVLQPNQHITNDTCIGRCLHAGEVTFHIAGARVDPQQVCRSPHDNAKGPVRAGPISQVDDVFEFGDAESLTQAESHGRTLFLRDYTPPLVLNCGTAAKLPTVAPLAIIFEFQPADQF
jgi:hypothetical protein